jgi:hypothetical protein
MSDPSRVLNPVEVEQAIRESVATVAQGVDVVTQRLAAYRDAQWRFDQKWAATYMMAEGPVEERKQQCVLSCADEQAKLDVAEVAYKYAERKTRAAESALSAWQTLSRSVTAMYHAAGTGEY